MDRFPDRLPDPDERPGASVVIYDGQCGFCRQQVERLRAADRKSRLGYLSLHDPRVAERYPDLSREQLLQQMYVVDPAGRRYGGIDAVRYLSRQFPRFWPVAALLHIPCTGWLWRRLYRTVARHRYLLGGRRVCDSDACEVHL